MSIGKATAASAAEMLSTMAVRVRMLPCSGESAALRRSANTRSSGMFNTNSGLPARAWRRAKRAHPRCCSSACTGPGCCSTLGCCSRCCLSWARWMTTPVAMATHTQTLLSFIHCYDTAHPVPETDDTHCGAFKTTHALPALPVTPPLLASDILNAHSRKESLFNRIKEVVRLIITLRLSGLQKNCFCYALALLS